MNDTQILTFIAAHLFELLNLFIWLIVWLVGQTIAKKKDLQPLQERLHELELRFEAAPGWPTARALDRQLAELSAETRAMRESVVLLKHAIEMIQNHLLESARQ